MKIKLAILEQNQIYLNRIVTAFSTKYADKLEIYSFTDMDIALATLDSSRIDVLIAGEEFDVDTSKIPGRCGFAYFVEAMDIDTIKGHMAICKFQKAELIYKQILSVYSENAGNISGLKLGDGDTKIIVFSSPCGGVGTSTVAASCAAYYAGKGSKTLYLNLEKFGTSDVFFAAEGQFDMSDIIYAIKSRKANLLMKLESSVKQDANGVYFYSGTKVAMDMLELTAEDIINLISELKLAGTYDYIVIDKDFGVDKDSISIYKQAHAVVWVSDGLSVSNTKIVRAYNALSIMEQNEERPLTERLCLIYNKFSNKTGLTVGDINIKNIGGAPVYLHATERQVMDQLSVMEMFGKIV
ncbi:MAG: chromosome partitioning protein ParA [Lachnospiraceae bacterium]|nr:chromosome partitioning protein ParA [Lachnospiraceae bacterium]